MRHRVIPFEKQINPGVDRNDPAAAVTAVELRFPDTFSDRAWKVIWYFEGAMFLYAYKGKFIATDESLELTEFGDGSGEAPYGAPRWVGDSLDDLEQWLLQIADEYDADADMIPGWEVEKPKIVPLTPPDPVRCIPSSSVLVKLSRSEQFIGVRTYSRKHKAHGRFLIYQSSLRWLMQAPVGSTKYESDCGDYVKIIRLKGALLFSFAWLNTYGDGSITGIRQDVTIPFFKIRAILDWKETEKYLYIPPTPHATIISGPASGTIRKIVQNKQLRRAFSKAMRDCFQWLGEEITLYRDGNHGFFFTTKSGCPSLGGLILHDGMKNGYPYVYYSTHT